jgi:uncharacterized protein YfaP (DUF2135 family)
MTKTLRNLFMLVVLGMFSSSVWSVENNPGGQGQIMGNDCFTTRSEIVKQVCARYTIRWKMWGLMGEPVGDYNVSWKLTRIELMNPKNQSHEVYGEFSLIPEPLKKGIGAIELYIDGYAVASSSACVPGQLKRGCHHIGNHHFNTGVAVRAGAGSSYNVPGSPNWNKLFVQSGNPCEDKFVTFMDADNAKKNFSQNFQLDSLWLCPTSGVSELTSLESAIHKLCSQSGADKQYKFCPKQKLDEKKAVVSNAIDDAFAKMEKQTRETADTTMMGDIDTEFGKVETYHADQERKRKEELERIAQKPVRITNFQDNDRVNTRVVEIRGNTQGYALNETLVVHFNNATQQVITNQNGEFSSKIVLKSGSNAIRACFRDRCSSLNLIADIEQLALMVTLTWEGRGDLDLYVEAPSGDTCSYKSKQKNGVCNLDIDDTKGNNPENISVPLDAAKGNYRFWVINYNGVNGVSGTLKLYQNEKLVDTRNFLANGSSGSTVVSVDLANYR